MDMKLEIAKSLSAACGVAAEEIAAAIEVPANTDMGDFAVSYTHLTLPTTSRV